MGTLAKKTFRWFCENRQTGEITIGQTPNALAISVFVMFLGRLGADIFNAPLAVLTFFRWTFAICLLAFGLDELLRGVNPWRRIMGAAIVVAAVLSIYVIVK